MRLEMRHVIPVLYSGLYFILAGALAALAVLSFRENVPDYARENPCFLPVRKMAVFLYRKMIGYRERRKKRGKDILVPGEEGVRSDFSVLYPSMKARRREIVYGILKTERILLLLTGGILFAGILHFHALGSGVMQEDGTIERAPAGGENQRVSVTARPMPTQAEAPGQAEASGQDEAPGQAEAPEEGGDESDRYELSEEGDLNGGQAEALGEAQAPGQDEAPEEGGDESDRYELSEEGDLNGGQAEALGEAQAPGQDEAPEEGGDENDRYERMEQKGREVGLGAAVKQESEGEEGKRDYGIYTFTVHARRLTRQEAAALSEKILKRFPDCLLGENTDPENIRFPLEIPDAEEFSPFVTELESSRYAVLDTDGSIFNSEYSDEQAEQVDLTVFLTYGEWRFDKKMSFTVRAPVRDEETKIREGIEKTLKTAEIESASENRFVLPAEADGIALTWEEKIEDVSPGILLIGILVCMCAWYMMDRRLHEQTIARSRQLALDYPRFISRIALYLGAGMSVRNVFYKCASEYLEQREAEKQRKTGKKSGVRYLYEEVLLVCNELDSGIPEAEAYMHFGRRCHSRQYTKLCSLLVQNLRRGNDTLLAILQEEAQSSFEERKTLARELGEEAGTKLLFPMMIMLGVTMMIIIVPAYFSFSM